VKTLTTTLLSRVIHPHARAKHTNVYPPPSSRLKPPPLLDRRFTQNNNTTQPTAAIHQPKIPSVHHITRTVSTNKTLTQFDHRIVSNIIDNSFRFRFLEDGEDALR
jgi:hypothetical protein